MMQCVSCRQSHQVSMARIAEAFHLFSFSGWSKFALLITWIIWGPCSFILCFVNKGSCRNLWTGCQIWGGVSSSLWLALAYDSLPAFSVWGCGRLSHAAKLGSSLVQNWLHPQVGKEASSKLCRLTAWSPAFQSSFSLPRTFCPCPSSTLLSSHFHTHS